MVTTKSKMANRYSPEVRTRTVRMVFEHQGSYETQAGAIAAIAPKIGYIPQTVGEWVKQAEKDSGLRNDVTTEERDRIKPLEREVRELCQANEILRKGEPLSANGPRIVCARIAIGSSAMKTVPTSEQFAPERLVMSSFERHAASRCGRPSPREMAGAIPVICETVVLETLELVPGAIGMADGNLLALGNATDDGNLRILRCGQLVHHWQLVGWDRIKKLPVPTCDAQLQRRSQPPSPGSPTPSAASAWRSASPNWPAPG